MPHENGRWSLTPRHREVLQLIMQGMTNREIAETLRISRRTVEVHRTNIMRRLGARNISDLFREAIVQRLVPKRFWRHGGSLEAASAAGQTNAEATNADVPVLTAS